jgi:hypothetical protein
MQTLMLKSVLLLFSFHFQIPQPAHPLLVYAEPQSLTIFTFDKIKIGIFINVMENKFSIQLWFLFLSIPDV